MKKAIEEAKKIVLAELSQDDIYEPEYVIDAFIQRLEAKEEEPTTGIFYEGKNIEEYTKSELIEIARKGWDAYNSILVHKDTTT